MVFRCEHCSRSFKTQNSFELHCIAHDELIRTSGGYSCSVCLQHYLSSEEYVAHIPSAQHQLATAQRRKDQVNTEVSKKRCHLNQFKGFQ